jgi:cobalt-zinc-cadmium efflux system membrane fusion protein
MKLIANMVVLQIALILILVCNRDPEHENYNPESDPVADEEHKESSDIHAHADEDLLSMESEWEKLVGLETVTVQKINMEQTISVPGQIVPDQNEVALVSPFIESSINCVFVNLGERVSAGDELACLTSPEIGILRAEYDKAKAELEIQRQSFERRRKLYQENIISEKMFQESELDKKIAEVQCDYAVKKLLAIGIPENELDNPPTGHSNAVGSTIHVHAPISGVITVRNASIGQKVEPAHQLFQIINIEKVWCEADIFEKDIVKVALGQKVKVRVSAYPGEIFMGKIFFIGSTLHAETKTVKILVEIKNDSEKLKPGMFADTHIIIGEKSDALALPKEAIVDDENLKVVFVREGEAYHRHIVQTGITSDAYIEILSGVSPGDVIVTKGNYQLKSKLKMGSVDPHAGHVH